MIIRDFVAATTMIGMQANGSAQAMNSTDSAISGCWYRARNHRNPPECTSNSSAPAMTSVMTRPLAMTR